VYNERFLLMRDKGFEYSLALCQLPPHLSSSHVGLQFLGLCQYAMSHSCSELCVCVWGKQSVQWTAMPCDR